LKDPDKVQFPSDDLILLALSVEESRGYIPFALLDDFLLDRSNGPVIETLASATPRSRIIGRTHEVN
jgi:hypothetical protein